MLTGVFWRKDHNPKECKFKSESSPTGGGNK